MKWLLCAIFVAYVNAPMSHSRRYTDVDSYRFINDMSIQLNLSTGKTVVVPAMWTVIEER